MQQRGFGASIAQAIGAVLQRLWQEAWIAGSKAAGGHADPLALTTLLAQLASRWIDQITGTTLGILARVLAAGKATVEALQKALGAPDRARDIAQTEITRVMAFAAQKVYGDRGHTHVRWVTEPPDPCPECLANEAAGAWPIGVPFPSGAMAPPQHPRCRCALVPA